MSGCQCPGTELEVFFFQAEDGIRDWSVTGVQTCVFRSACGSKGDNDVTIAIGLPLQICNIAEERIEYKDFILGEIGKEHTVKIKPVCNGPVLTVKFRFKAERVYPEGIGVLYEYPTQFSGPTGIIDIGNLNINLLYSDQFLPLNESCSTDELGGQILLTGLAQELTSNFARCDEHMALSILARKELNRCLPDKTGKHPEIVEESRKIIKNNYTLRKDVITCHY